MWNFAHDTMRINTYILESSNILGGESEMGDFVYKIHTYSKPWLQFDY